MIVSIVDLKGRSKRMNVSRDNVIGAAMKELLLSHDGLYRKVFAGTPAKPQWDIAAKNARRVYEALVKKKPIPKLTLEIEMLYSSVEKEAK